MNKDLEAINAYIHDSDIDTFINALFDGDVEALDPANEEEFSKKVDALLRPTVSGNSPEAVAELRQWLMINGIGHIHCHIARLVAERK